MFISPAWRASWPLLLLSVTCSLASAGGWAPRCAVVVEGPSATEGASVASLVEASLSAQNVQLVDRQSIDRLLQEQYLSKTGLIDADHAVSAGKLLSADLLAFINTSADTSSIIVFDANTGVRLEDATTALSGETLAEELSRDIHNAIEKGSRERNAAAGGIKTVCLQTVRNADLPLEKGSIARAAGQILMRRLAGSPDVAVLERERLSHVTAERQLTGVENALVASTVSIELQIARDADRSGIIVSAVLDYASHERKPVPALHVATENPAEIAGAILPQIVQMLQVTEPKAPTDAQRVAESKRFVREVMLLWNHREVGSALDAAEAAFALDPRDFHVGAVHARAILVAGMGLVFGGDFIDPSRPSDMGIRVSAGPKLHQTLVDPAKMSLMLQLVGRGSDALELLEFGGSAPGPTTAPANDLLSTPLDRDPIAANADDLIRHLLCMMRFEMFERRLLPGQSRMVQLTADQQALFAALQEKLRHRRFELEREFLRSQVKDYGELGRYEIFIVQPLFEEARCIWSADGAAWTKDWAALIADWIVLEKQFRPPSVVSPRSGRASAARSPMPSALLGLTFRPQIVQLYGCSFDYNLKMTPQDWQRLIDAIAQLGQLPGSGAEQFVREVNMRAAPFIHPSNLLGPDVVSKDELLRRWRPIRAPTLVEGNTADEPAVGPGSLWPDSLLLVDYAPGHDTLTEYGGYIALPRIDYASKTVYVLSHPTFGQGRRRETEFDSFSLVDGTRRVISTFVGTGPVGELPELGNSYLNGGSAALSGGYYVYCDPTSGIYLFPLSGAPVVSVTAASAQLPTSFYQAAALLEDTLFMAVGRPGEEGYILAQDLKTRTLRTLASSRRVGTGTQSTALPGNPAATQQRPSPFDDAAPLFVWHMQTDDAEHRVVFLVSNSTWPKGLSGWWEFRQTTGKFKLLIPLEIGEAASNNRIWMWVHSLKNRRIAFGLHGSAPAVLALATDTVSPLPPVPAAPSFYSGPGRRFHGEPVLKFPFSEVDGWVWGSFGRYRYPISGSMGHQAEIQSFDPLRNMTTQWGAWPVFLEPMDGDHVVVGDSHGLWFLHVPSNDAAAMARLVQPPRPLYVPVEPVGKPPTGGAVPWSSMTTIYDSLRKENLGVDPPIQLLFAPQVVGESVYVVGTSPLLLDKGRLLKFSLNDGKRTEMQTVSLPYFGKPTFMSLGDQVSMKYPYAGSCVDDHYYYIATASDTIVAAPLDGGDVQQEKFTGTVAELAAVDGQLFTHVMVTDPPKRGIPGSGWTERHEIICVDVLNGARRTVHLSNPSPATQPSNTTPQFRIKLLRADPSRHRVLFFANRFPNPQADFDGLWSCAIGATPTRVEQFDIWPTTGLRMGAGPYDWCSNVDGDTWLLYSPNGLVKANLATGKVEHLWQVEPAGASILDTKYQFRPPITVLDQMLWTGTLQRASLDGSVFEQIEWTRVMDHHLFEATWMMSIHHGNDLLLADSCGMWIAKMKGR